MGGLRATFDTAVARHRSAAHRLAHARAAVDASVDVGPDAATVAAENALAQRLTAAATALRSTPGLVYLGDAQLHQSAFPVHVPFLGGAHLAFSVDGRDPRVANLMRSILLQAFATAPAGTVEAVVIDPAAVGATVAPLQPLIDARLLTAGATDPAGIDAAFQTAEDHVKAALRGERASTLVLVIATIGELSRPQRARLDALAHSGVSARLHILAGGVGELSDAVNITVDGRMRVGHAPRTPFGNRDGLAAPVGFPAELDSGYVRAEANRIAERAKAAAKLRFADLLPDRLWTQDPGDGVSAVSGADAQGTVSLAFDDETPHWLIGGRTGGGKTVFLLDILYGLTARYAPGDLALYLLDFKEGVSFTEFTPQESDPTFIPHARVVGVESDREYGAAILRELDAEMTRRSVLMKRQGAARYSQLTKEGRPPRIVCIVDEFQVLFAGNDKLAKEAVGLLENLARKGRSYGVHLVLASQTTSGIEALYNKQDSIFGQFPMRIALPGANSVLDQTNTAAVGLRTGEAVINTDGGAPGRDRKIRFPNAHAESETLHALRHRMWNDRGDITAPSVFYGYAAVHIDADPEYAALTPTDRPRLLVGRTVDAALSPAQVRLDPTPGRHLSVLGSDSTGAHILHAAATALHRQQPGARYLIADHANTTAATELATQLGDRAEPVAPGGLAAALTELTGTEGPAYLIGFGLDGANLDRAALANLRSVLRDGPARGIHVLGWWRGLRRFIDDLGGSSGREDVSCSVVLNIPGQELMTHFGQWVTDWAPRPGRALLIDRHANTRHLLVPFTRREAA